MPERCLSCLVCLFAFESVHRAQDRTTTHGFYQARWSHASRLSRWIQQNEPSLWACSTCRRLQAKPASSPALSDSRPCRKCIGLICAGPANVARLSLQRTPLATQNWHADPQERLPTLGCVQIRHRTILGMECRQSTALHRQVALRKRRKCRCAAAIL